MAKKKRRLPDFSDNRELQFRKEIVGIFVLALAFFLFMGNRYVSGAGLVGRVIFGDVLTTLIGSGMHLLPHFTAVTGFLMLFGPNFTRMATRTPGMIMGYALYLVFLEVQSNNVTSKWMFSPIKGHEGGVLGYTITYILQKIVGIYGVQILLVAGVVVSLLLIFDVTIFQIVSTLLALARALGRKLFYREVVELHEGEIVEEAESAPSKKEKKEKKKKSEKVKVLESKKEKPAEPKKEVSVVIPVKEKIEITERDVEEVNEIIKKNLGQENPDFELPDISLLSQQKKSNDNSSKIEKEIHETIVKLEETMESFKVQITVVDTSQGPSVTRYELQPGPGVKVSKIVNLSDDIALSLAAHGVRIEAPVPGKSVVGIEIPNHTRQMVTMLPLATDDKFIYSNAPLQIALGMDIEGSPTYLDINKMPHLLVAGATGAGKSVCINTLIISILMRNTPETVRFIMIDPKKVELSVYDDIPHLIAPVVTDPKKAAVTLRWCCKEMERRYEELAKLGVRNIESFNDKIDELMKERDAMSDEEKEGFFIPAKYPYIVIIIDELSDLMMIAASEVETSIARVAQMARAVGLHLVIATQRPSVDVITGLIKANVPSRISFAVSSQIDSRTILDSVGAEKLLGKGDMLYKPVGSMRPTRIQGVYISDKEIHQIVKFVKGQGDPEYLQEVVNLKAEDLDEKKGDTSAGNDDFDEFFEEAKNLVVSTGNVSISFIQRKLRIGYNRAARIMEQLEEVGIVSPADSDGKGRTILL
jgi:DNA segregation ATPase FtsK/SpoIIIE, S-DNA-T family